MENPLPTPAPFAEVTFIEIITVIDPDSKLPVEVQLFKDHQSGGIVGIDGSFLSDTENVIYSPYNLGVIYNDESL